MPRKRPTSSVSAITLALLLGGCVAPQPGPAPHAPRPPDALAAVGRWTLQGADDAQGRAIAAVAPHGIPVHAMALTDGTLVVEGGCNRMRGAYRYAANGDLVVAALASTRMACADTALMDADTALGALLEGRAGFRIAESWPEQLTLDHDDGSRSHWVASREVP